MWDRPSAEQAVLNGTAPTKKMSQLEPGLLRGNSRDRIRRCSTTVSIGTAWTGLCPSIASMGIYLGLNNRLGRNRRSRQKGF